MTVPPTSPGPALGLHQPAAPDELSQLLDRYGIAVIMNPVYQWGGYRYSNAGDAVAAALRAEAGKPSA